MNNNNTTEMNNNNIPVKKNSFGKNFIKGWLICFGLGFGMFFFALIVRLIIGIANDGNIPDKNSILGMILFFIQFMIPILAISFGWVFGLIYASTKDK